jgi:hypothetical protein
MKDAFAHQKRLREKYPKLDGMSSAWFCVPYVLTRLRTSLKTPVARTTCRARDDSSLLSRYSGPPPRGD